MINDAEAARLYQMEKLSVRDVARRLDVSVGAAYSALRRAGVVMRGRGARPSSMVDLTKEAARDLLSRGWDPEKAAQVLNVSEASVEELQRGEYRARRPVGMVRRRARNWYFGQMAFWPQRKE